MEALRSVYRDKIGRIENAERFRSFLSGGAITHEKRYGNRVPDSEPVISPVDMFHSSELITVVNH